MRKSRRDQAQRSSECQRGEIAIRILRAANELGRKTHVVYLAEDKISLDRLKADEALPIGHRQSLAEGYPSIPEIIRVAKASGTDRVHPCYWLLSGDRDCVEAVKAAGQTSMGRSAATMLA